MLVPEAALRGERHEAEYGSILVPLSGSPLDDDIIQTAGRLAAEEDAEAFEDDRAPPSRRCGSSRSRCRCRSTRALPEAQLKQARAALARAKAVGEEYEGVEVATATVRARRAGQAIVDEAKRRGVQAVVLAAEEPSKIRGGALLGGRGGPLDDFVGEATKYVSGQGAVPGHPHRAARLRRAPARRRLAGRRAAGSRGARRRRCRGRDARCSVESAPMPLILIVGAGRVGSSVARSMLAAGNEVSILDEDPLSHERLDSGMDTTWEDSGGRFTVGHGLEIDALSEAGIEEADVFIASTDGDNTNLTIAQIASKQFGVPKVIVRVMDPASRRVVRGAGAAHDLPHALRDRDVRARPSARGLAACTS